MPTKYSQLGRPPWLLEPLNGTFEEALEQDINQLTKYLVPKTHHLRSGIYQMLRQKLQSKGYELECFGSCSSGLYLDYSDIDLVIIIDKETPNANAMKRVLKKIFTVFHQYPNFEFISKARIPIFKLKIQGFSIDISVNNRAGSIGYNNFIFGVIERFPLLGKLLVILKQFLRCRGLECNATGGVGGYFLFLWVLSYLQQNYSSYQFNAKDIDYKTDFQGIRKPFETNLDSGGKELMGFLRYFADNYDYSNWKLEPCNQMQVISNRDPEIFKKGLRLIIIDPLNHENRLELPAERIVVLVGHFRDCYNTLGKSKRYPGSPLGLIMNIEEIKPEPKKSKAKKLAVNKGRQMPKKSKNVNHKGRDNRNQPAKHSKGKQFNDGNQCLILNNNKKHSTLQQNGKRKRDEIEQNADFIPLSGSPEQNSPAKRRYMREQSIPKTSDKINSSQLEEDNLQFSYKKFVAQNQANESHGKPITKSTKCFDNSSPGIMGMSTLANHYATTPRQQPFSKNRNNQSPNRSNSKLPKKQNNQSQNGPNSKSPKSQITNHSQSPQNKMEQQYYRQDGKVGGRNEFTGSFGVNKRKYQQHGAK